MDVWFITDGLLLLRVVWKMCGKFIWLCECIENGSLSRDSSVFLFSKGGKGNWVNTETRACLHGTNDGGMWSGLVYLWTVGICDHIQKDQDRNVGMTRLIQSGRKCCKI